MYGLLADTRQYKFKDWTRNITQAAFICSTSTMEIPEQYLKFVER